MASLDLILPEPAFLSAPPPTVVNALSDKNITAIAAGRLHGLAISSGGEIYSWGWNMEGQLGYEDEGFTVVPALVSDLSGKTITAAAGGWRHTLALDSSGKVYSWGDNQYGQLGYTTDSISDNTEPRQITDFPAGIVINKIAAGELFSLALTSGGRVYAWGKNSYGQHGNGGTTRSTSPVASDLPSSVSTKAIAAGPYFSLALTTGGQVYSWGDNSQGQLGYDTANDSDYSAVPTLVSALSGKTITAIAAGSFHSLALTDEGRVYSWGYNLNGQLGDGTEVSRSNPMPVEGLTGAVSIAGGDYFSLAIVESGRVYAWGNNDCGELGLGNTGDVLTPIFSKGSQLALSKQDYSQEDLNAAVASAIAKWDSNYNGVTDLMDVITGLQILADIKQ